MALPTERTVTGTYTNPVTGEPYDGTSGENFIIFDPVPDVWTDRGGNQVLTGGGKYNLDVTGSFSEELVCTDADDVLPETGKLWKLRAHVGGEWLPPTYFELPVGDGTPIDITDMISVTIDGITYVPVPGPEGPAGPAGADGGTGADGASAYEVAVENGFVGTESEWLASLQGAEGPEGPEGPQGPPGEVTEAELAAALLGYAQLTGATFTGLVTLNGANFVVQAGDASKAYRFRQDGGSLDFEGAGSDMFISVFQNGDFTGDQFQYLRLESGAQVAHATGKWIFVDGPFGAAVHTLDGFANEVGFHGAVPVGQATITGERSTGAALASLLTALGLRGDIVDTSTAGPTLAADADVVKLTGNQTIGGTKTFSLSPTAPTPTTNSQVAIKSYVDTGDAAVQANVDGVAADLTTLDGEVVKLTGDQTVAGIKTFSSTPVGPTADPTTADQLSRKAYVDAGDASVQADVDTVANDLATLDGEVVKLTGAQTVAGVKTFSSVPVGPASDPTTANQLTRKSYVDAGDAAQAAALLAETFNVFQPEDLGLVAWTSDPACCQSTIRYETANRIRSASVSIHKTTTVTDIVWYMLGYAGGLLDGSWAAIYNSAGNKVGTVANLEAPGSEPPEVHDAGGAMSGSPLDEGSIVLSPGVYTIVWRFIYTYSPADGPALLEYENSAGAPPNILSRNGVVRFGYSTAAITTPPATIPTLLTDGGNRFWVSLADDS